MSWESFLYMGGYALYVWGSFGISALVVVGEIWQVRSKRREIVRNLLNETNSHKDSTLL